VDKKDFFISYNKADKAWAKWIAGVLEENGYSTWLQAWDIRPGDEFIAKMNEFLENSSAYIPVFSQEFKDSPYCELEFSAALDKRIKVETYRFLPVRIAEVAPPDLVRTIVYIDLFNLDEAKAEKKLLHAVDPNPIPRERPPFPSGTANVRTPFPGEFPTNNLPDRNTHFTGREELLDEIHREFQNGRAVSLRQTIAGLGGVGKTQTAIEFAYHNAGDYDVIWWINAENERGVEDAYHAFARRKSLPLVNHANGEPDVLETVKEWFDTHHRFLFIFDNVEDFDVLDDCLPRNTGQVNGHVLTTTRNTHGAVGKTVDITVFPPEEAKLFLKKWLGRDEGDDAAKLAERLGFLPLALEQAAAYILATKDSCKTYLGLLEEEGLLVFDELAAEAHDYNETINTTWKISFMKIELESAKQVFHLCAWFAPDNIPTAMLIEGRNHLPEPLQTDLEKKLSLNRAIYELTRFSLVVEKDGLLSIHRLVQEVVRNRLADGMRWLSCCLNMARAVFEYEWGNMDSMAAFERNVSHFLAIAGYAEEAFGDDEEALEKTAWLYHKAGNGFHYSDTYREALEWYERAKVICEKVLGKEHPNTAATYNNIALVYDSQGEYVKALEWYETALVIREKMLGNEHPDTAATYSNIANVYDHLGNFANALEWHEKALDIYEKVLGKEHPDTATVYNNMAEVYRKQGNYADALEWYKKALAVNERVFGKEHPTTAVIYNNIAVCYSNRGDQKRALEWHEKALAIREKVLGKEHSHTAVTYNNIGEIYRKQGNYGKALEWFEKSLAIREKVLGKEHPDTAATYHDIANVYDDQGDYAKALGWYEKALTIYEKVLGKEHPHTAQTYNNMAIVFYRQGDYAKALEWHEKALAVRKKVWGKEHPDISQSYNNIAIVYGSQRNYNLALKWFLKALAINKKVLGKEHTETAGTYLNIAKVYDEQGDYEKALEWHEKSLRIAHKILGPNHPQFHNHLNNAKITHLHSGCEESFEEWLAEVLAGK